MMKDVYYEEIVIKNISSCKLNNSYWISSQFLNTNLTGNSL